MPDRFDIVVAGAGHNSLIAAAYLAKAGFRCLVLEGRPVVGGNCVTEELTLPGFQHDSCGTAHVVIQDSPLVRNDELGLKDYGLEYIHPEIAVHIPFADGTWLTQWRDADRTCEEFAKFSRKDAAAYRRMIAEYEAVKPLFDAVSYTPVGWGKPIHERLADSLVYGRQRWSWCVPKGGSGAFSGALARVVEAHGGVILTDKRVAELVVENGRCVGVACADGSTYRAGKAVLSTIHIKHLVGMAPRDAWGDDFVAGVDTWAAGPTLFVTHYATTEPMRFQVDGGTREPMAVGLMATPTRALRMGYDYARGAVNLEDPVLLAVCPTVVDPGRAPPGKHTIKIIGFQPYDLPQGAQHWDEIKELVSATNLNYLRRFATNLSDDKILARCVESPLDLERMNPHNWHGSCHGGAQNAAQSGNLRPVPGWAAHRMPIAGLYQTGSTTHPGGSISAGPGRNAAAVLLKDLGSSLDAAVAGKTSALAPAK